jgi:hypothetical protein
VKAKSWTTEDEIAFIAYLGKRLGRFDRDKLLQGYIKGCERRINWGGIDRAKVVIFANEGLQWCKKCS